MFLPRFRAIAACDALGVMGQAGKLPWHHSEDLEHFRSSTRGHVILMGYHTFCSLPPILFIDRVSLVFTKDHSIDQSRVVAIKDLMQLEDYYKMHRELFEKTNFVIGGGAIFNLFFSQDLIETALITHIDGQYEGDVYFPLHYLSNWCGTPVYKGVGFSIVLYCKKKEEHAG